MKDPTNLQSADLLPRLLLIPPDMHFRAEINLHRKNLAAVLQEKQFVKAQIKRIIFSLNAEFSDQRPDTRPIHGGNVKETYGQASHHKNNGALKATGANSSREEADAPQSVQVQK